MQSFPASSPFSVIHFLHVYFSIQNFSRQYFGKQQFLCGCTSKQILNAVRRVQLGLSLPGKQIYAKDLFDFFDIVVDRVPVDEKPVADIAGMAVALYIGL